VRKKVIPAAPRKHMLGRERKIGGGKKTSKEEPKKKKGKRGYRSMIVNNGV